MPRGRFPARGGFRGRASGRSPTAWAGFVATDATVATGTAQIVASIVPVAGTGHETVVRIVGDWQAEGAGINGSLVLGALVATDAAVAAGAAAVPDPITEIQDDIWVMISSISVSIGARSAFNDPVRFDSRAMRKIDEGSQLVFIIANNTDGNMGFSMYLRALAKIAVRS